MALDKLVDSTQLDADLTSVANAIRTKGGTQAQLAFPSGFVSAIGDIPTECGYTIDQISTVGFPALSDNVVFNGTQLRPYLFRGSGIKAFSGQNVINVNGAPYGAGSNVYTFSNCESLEYVSLPSLRSLVDADNLFLNCSALSTIDFNWKLCTGLGASTFSGCVSLNVPIIVMPLLDTNIWPSCFYKVVKLQKFDAYNSNYNTARDIRGLAFERTAIDTLILRGGKLINLGNISAFKDTPFASTGTGGTLYVPQALLSSYQSATNWSTILGYANNQIKSIESTHTDPNAPIDLTLYYVDGTSILTT